MKLITLLLALPLPATALAALKTLYMVYCILALGASVIRIEDDDHKILWAAHDLPQDGYGGHSGLWVEAETPQEAVWRLYHQKGNTEGVTFTDD